MNVAVPRLVFWLVTFSRTMCENKKACQSSIDRLYISGDSVGIRTPNLLIRSQVLYPIELQNQSLIRVQIYSFFVTCQALRLFFLKIIDRQFRNTGAHKETCLHFNRFHVCVHSPNIRLNLRHRAVKHPSFIQYSIQSDHIFIRGI